MIIDTHLHVGFKGFSEQELINYLDANGIEKCWLLTWEEQAPVIDDLYQHLSIDRVLEAYHNHPDRIVPFYAPDPGRRNVESLISKYLEMGVQGIGELKVKYKWSSPEMLRYLKAVDGTGCPVLFHMEADRYHFIPPNDNVTGKALDVIMNRGFNGVVRKYVDRFINLTGLFKEKFKARLKYFPGYLMDFQGLEKRLQQFPDINFIAHGPRFWNHVSRNPDEELNFMRGKVEEEGIAVQLLKEYDNLYADISGKSGFNALTRDEDFAKELLHECADKLLYGTDNYELGHFEAIKSFELPKQKEELILHENAEALIQP